MSVLSLVRYALSGVLPRRLGGALLFKDKFIDVHAHYLPSFYLDAMRAAGIGDVDGWPLPEWSVNEAIQVMDRHGVDAQILSVSSPGVSFASDIARPGLARRLNEYVARLIREYTPRFGAFAVLPLPDVEASLREIEYALDVLGLDGVGLLSNYGGTYLGDPSFEPVFAELNRRRTVVFIHPTAPPIADGARVKLPAPIIEYPFDTTRVAANLVSGGVIDRYPEVDFMLAHGGGTIPYLYPRLAVGVGVDKSDQFGRFLYDLTATTVRVQTSALRAVTSSNRMLIGFDYPFMDEGKIKPAVASLHLSGFTSSEMFLIYRGNAEHLFPKVVSRIAETRK